MNNKKYRFFFHYYRAYNELSVHFKGKCYRTKDVDCKVPIESKWNKQQPNLVMQGWATNIKIEENKIQIFNINGNHEN